MSDYEAQVNTHYGQIDLSSKILATLKATGRNIDALTRDDLRSFDEFHFGGIAETRNLAKAIPGLSAGTTILDMGSGLGGPARTLAAEFGCKVTGIDLTEAFCDAATMLTERVGLQDRATFRQGSVLDMPFEDSNFDVAWTQFVGMNVSDKERFYSEIRRILRNGGYFAFHEVMAGKVAPIHFPVFWAEEASISFLKTPDEIRQLLSEQGFQEIVWRNLSQSALSGFKTPPSTPRPANEVGLGLGELIVERAPQKAANIIRNFEEGRIIAIQSVWQVNK